MACWCDSLDATTRTTKIITGKVKMPSDLHNDLCIRAEKWLKQQNCGVVFHDRFQAMTWSGEKPDALGFRSDCSILIECKATRSDFLSDKRKIFRAHPELGIGDWRFYMCPPNIIKTEDLPEGWGLLYVEKNRVLKVHGVPPNSKWVGNKPFEGNKTAEMQTMYSALRRVYIRGHFNCIYEPLTSTNES